MRQASVFSRPYYFSTGLSQYSIIQYMRNRLQRVQNYAACLMTHTHKEEQKIPVVFLLDVLPVLFRPLYQIMFLAFKVLI